MLHSRTCSKLILVGACGATGVGSMHVATAQEALGRYSLPNTRPSAVQRNVLLTPVIVGFADNVHTVGDAVAVLLAPTGYRLSTPSSAALERAALLALPLPAVHRALNGFTTRHALHLLVGPTFHVIEDPIHRLISFERCGVRTESTNDTHP